MLDLTLTLYQDSGCLCRLFRMSIIHSDARLDLRSSITTRARLDGAEAWWRYVDHQGVVQQETGMDYPVDGSGTCALVFLSSEHLVCGLTELV